MEPFAEIIRFINAALENDPYNWSNTVVEQVTRNYTSYEPPTTFLELRDFVNHWANAVQHESTKTTLGTDDRQQKRSSDVRVQAIMQVLNRARQFRQANGNGNNPMSPHFAGVGLLPFVEQLVLRIRKPSLIDQGTTALCGTVALLHEYAKQSPMEFAMLAMDLFELGQGMLRNLQVDPSMRTKQRFASRARDAHLLEVDYVLLASVRECGPMSALGNGFHVANQTLTGGALCALLEQAGYANVTDHTFLGFGSGVRSVVRKVLHQPVYSNNHVTNVRNTSSNTQKRVSLTQAAQELQNGNIVFLLGHGDISKAIRDGNGRVHTSIFQHGPVGMTLKRHWTAVRRLNVNPATVDIRLITWGGKYEGRMNINDFLELYEGYVSATP